MQWSQHGRKRAHERFPGIDLEDVYLHTRHCGKKTRMKIRKACPRSTILFRGKGFMTRYCRITKDRIVFVMQYPETVVTVFRLENKKVSTVRPSS